MLSACVEVKSLGAGVLSADWSVSIASCLSHSGTVGVRVSSAKSVSPKWVELVGRSWRDLAWSLVEALTGSLATAFDIIDNVV